MVNRVTLIGNLGRDPEIRTLETGAMVAKFSVATDEGYRDTSGNWVDRVEWHGSRCLEATGRSCAGRPEKGMLIYVEGKLSTRKWKDQNDVERYRTEVVANYFRILNSRGLEKPGTDPAVQQPATVQEGQSEGGAFPESTSYEEDLPF
ncbi:MAG: single-stranded DNA-binding protein [Saprospirales bacterium]|nr:single-stranded DNA-binding protein [Saprospirales bacterium]